MKGKALLAGCIALSLSNMAFAKDIKVAVVGAMSGPVAQYGDQEFTGAEQAIADINAKGGVKGDKLVIVIYDIFFAYMEDTKEAHDNGEWENYKTALRNASKTISELISSLDFSYELAGELYRIYVFCRETLAKAMYKRDLKEVELAENLMKKLYTAFAEVMKEDTSAPLMRNTQQIYAGYTYGKNDLVETYQDFDTSRGFLV